MDGERAKQIINSPEAIEVLYQGSPVWIENVNNNNTAEITFLGAKNKIEVPTYLLVEKK